MKRKFKFFSALTFSTALLFVPSMMAEATTYLETDKNYYQDDNITKGFLNKVISDGADGNEKTTETELLVSLEAAAAKGLVVYKDGMTYNDYFLANNISPEDNFMAYRENPGSVQEVAIPDKAGVYNAKLSPNPVLAETNPITYVGPATNKGLAYWGENVISKPIFFSRLTVGSLPAGSTEGQLSLFNRDTHLMPNRIGYGEVATVNDYMLTPENDIIIPTRFNQSRNDVYLTMRAHQYFGAGFDTPRAFLSATINGVPVQSKAQNPNAYLNLTGNVYITHLGYSQLGFLGQFSALGFPDESRESIHDIGVNELTQKTSSLLKAIDNNKKVPIGTGAQLQINGFYRQSDHDTDFTQLEATRQTDSKTIVDVTYYVYTERATNITTPIASNGKQLYSPNETSYKIEITRPYFTNFGDLATPVQFDEKTFDNDLGVNSFNVMDNGKLANGDDVTVDVTRVKVRLDDGNGFTAKEYTLDELKVELSKAQNSDKTFQVAYTYAASDAQDTIVGKLPAEIANDTGAYAVPFVRSITVPKQKGKLTVQYVNTDGIALEAPVVTQEAIDTPYTTTPKTISGYELLRVEGNEQGLFTNTDTVVTYVYEKHTTSIPNNPPTADEKETIKTTEFLDEKGNKLADTIFKTEIAEPLTINGYELLKTEKTATGLKHVYVKQMTSIPNNPPTADEKETIKTTEFLDEKGNKLADTIFKTEIAEPLTINGYELLKTEKTATGLKYVYVKQMTSIPNNPPTADEKETIKTTEFLDEKGNKLADTIFKTEIAEPLTINGYELVRTQQTSKGIKYIYTEKQTNSKNNNNPQQIYNVSQNRENKLPKTGTIAHKLISFLGMALVGLGLIINRKTKKNN